jgi:hypothetical protein
VGITKHSAKSDILTPWKEAERHRREVYPTSGVADAAVRSGVFHRALNTTRPELNSREGIARARTNIGGSLAQFVADHSGD